MKKNALAMLVLSLAVSLSLSAPEARAGMIASDAAQSQGERAHLKAELARPDLARQLEKFGITAADAQARVDVMSDREVHALAGKVDQLAAGGELTTTNTLLLIIVLLLILIAL